MRYPRRWQLAVVCLLALALIPFAPAPRGTAQAPGYTVTDLGTLGGGAGEESRAFGLDVCGHVVGESQAAAGSSSPFRPFLWDGTTLTDLGTLGGSSGTANAVSQGGTAVGSALTSGGLMHPFVRPTAGPMRDIGTLGGFSAEAQDINASGQVVGQSEEGSLQDRAFIWQDVNNNGTTDPGERQALTAPWGTPIRAFGINDAGQVAGAANLTSSAESHAFVTVGGVALDLKTLGGTVSVATEVNDPGEVVGYSYIAIPPNTITQFFHAFRWKDVNGNGQSDAGEMIDLGLLSAAHKYSYAYDINNAGQVVGASENGTGPNGSRGFIWQDVNANNQSDPGEMQDLNDAAPGTGWTFQEARAINNRGQIVGTGLNPDGHVHAFLLTPNNAGPSPCDPTPTPTPTATPTPVPGTLQFSAPAYTVGEGGGSVTISVSRTGGSDGAVTVNYATSDGSATQPADYATASGTLSFADGETTKTFSVNITDNTLHEPDETVNLTLSTPGGGATLGWPTTVLLSITDDDNQPTVQFSSATYSVSEGSATATVTVTRTGGTNGGVTVNYATSGGTATTPGDYTATTPGMLTFAEGDNSETFTVAVANDALDEEDETVYLTLSSPGGGAALGTPSTATLTITDDDATPTLSVNDVTVTEGNTGNSPATTSTFAVTLTGASAQDVTVYYSTANGTATQPGDYNLASGTVTFNPGETGARNITVSVVGDTTDEPNETFNVNLSNASASATISDTQGVGTINDDDGPPALSIGDVSVAEGNSGTTAATFTVSLLPASGQTVTVKYSTSDGTATAGSDYTALGLTTLTFDPGQTAKTITVDVTGDTTPEAHETFNVNLSGATNATISDAQGQGTIGNDDTSVSVNDPGAQEGNSGAHNLPFTVTLSHPSVNAVSLSYATSDGDATTADSDYVSTSGQVSVPAGATSATFNVQVNGDTKFENTEIFNVTLSGATGSTTISDGAGVGYINNDDHTPPAFSISDASAVTEGNTGTVNATFTISLSAPSGLPSSVAYQAANGTAALPYDYAPTSGTLNFAAGETSKNITVAVKGDTLFEVDETFVVNLTSPSGATIADAQGQGTITNDDTQPTLQFSPATYTLAEAGVNAIVTVTRTGGSNGGVTVNYATSNGTAAAGSDYTATSGTLTFAEGDTSKTFNVAINNDALDEPDETVNLALSGPGGAALGAQTTAVLTITDDDEAPTFKLDSATYTVAEGGTVTVTVTRTGGSNAATVNYNTANGTSNTATAGSDYAGVDFGTLSFAEGDASKTFQIATVNDPFDEPDETFKVNLLSNTGYALGTPNSATVTITDNDATPTLSFGDNSSNGDVTVAEGEGTAGFKVTLSAASGQTVTVNYETASGTAAPGSDYSAVIGTLTFAPGETTKSFGVPINNDAVDEPNETFFVNLSGAAGATVIDGQAVGTITDDDGEPSLTVSSENVLEGNTGTKNITFGVMLSPASDKTVTVDYATADGGLPAPANAPADYAATSGTLTFAPGETSKTVNVAVVGDTLDEAVFETFKLNISNPTNAAISNPTGVGTIIDDDDAAAPSISIGDATVTEGNSGTTAATFTVTLSNVSGQEVTVNYSTADGTAAAPFDYTHIGFATLSFAAGETTKTITVNVNGDTANEPDETFFVNLHSPAQANLADAQGQGTITNDDAAALSFSQAAYPVGEGAHFVTVTVTRTGNPALPVGVYFATSDGTATERRDYTAVSGQLQFAAGETSKTFDVLLTEDAYEEALETINLTLSNATGGASLGSQPTATVNIAPDDNPPPGFNPIDVSSDFVRQHYHDFLNREPDASGLAFWTGEIEQCGADARCREVKRINVSAAFFLSIEFQETGYLVYRTYKAAYGDATSPNVEGTVPVIRLNEFLPDTRRIGEGVVVNVGNWQAQLEANKNAYMLEFVRRQRFLNAYPQTWTPAHFVDTLNANAGGALDAAERQNLVDELTANNTDAGRASVLRKVAEDSNLVQAEFRRAFVLMQFYGYLRRNPDDPQDTDFRGWKFWLDKLNDHSGNYVEAEMVKAFLDSIEYRTRFAP